MSGNACCNNDLSLFFMDIVRRDPSKGLVILVVEWQHVHQK